jgi:hypothetical protein
LSIRFAVDGFVPDAADPSFTTGRVVGTIGVAHAVEPRHLVRGRQLAGCGPSQGLALLNFSTSVVDPDRGKVLCDLGNALPTQGPAGELLDQGPLVLAYGDGSQPIGEIVDYGGHGWYERTAGIVELPADRVLSAAELDAIARSPLMLTVKDTSGGNVGAEAPDGRHVRADQFVFRLDPGATADVAIYVTEYGAPLPGVTVNLALDPNALDPQLNNHPADGLSFPATVQTDEDGVAHVTLTAADPKSPRGPIDGQVYSVRPALEAATGPQPFDPWDFVSVLVWDAFVAGDPPTWHGDIAPILTQYAFLYPVMGRFLDLGDYADVCAHREMLALAFGLPAQDPNSMPVVRDLSAAKRAAIVRWLSEVGEDGKPLEGEPTGALRAAVQPAVPLPEEPESTLARLRCQKEGRG